jgi:phosphoadenosine phosphosulfate reductase
MLEDKIKYSIDLLKKHEQTALKMNPDGYYLAFSGGKDSQVIYELCKMAGIKFKAHFNCTTVDPKEVLHFIRERYPDVIWHRPEKSIFKLIEEKGILPQRYLRFCCRILKERSSGIGCVTVIGVRKQESKNRSKTKEIKHQCIKGFDKITLCPILNWSTKEVWEFIKNQIGYYCELYDRGFSRIGCILCPVVGSLKKKKRELELAPRFEYAYKKAIQKCMDNGSYKQFENSDDVFNWWIRGESMKKYFANKTQYKLNI